MIIDFSKKPVLFYWSEGATIYWVTSCYKFNIMNILHDLVARSMLKILVKKDMSNRSELNEKNIYQSTSKYPGDS